MSHEAVGRFLALLEDPGLRERLGLAGKVARTISLERFVELGAQQGCPFSADELRAHFSSAPRPLSDEELDRVSGGVGGTALVGGGTFTLRFGAPAKGGGFNELTLDDTAGKEK